MSPVVLKPPTLNEWQKIANNFRDIWQCPNCIGALDGKHIRIKAPSNSGSEFFNYKGFFSIILLALCDANYKFIYVDIGDSGRHSDGGVFRNSEMWRKLEDGTLRIPNMKRLPDSAIEFPHYFVADDAFPLRDVIMKPYPGRFLSPERRVFNYRLSRARRVVENAFGILAVRWQVFYRTLNCTPEMATLIVQACVVLHNFLCDTQSPSSLHGDFTRSDGQLVPGNWRDAIPIAVNQNPLQPLGFNRHSRSAGQYRDDLMRYFLTTGAVPWQLTSN